VPGLQGGEALGALAHPAEASVLSPWPRWAGGLFFGLALLGRLGASGPSDGLSPTAQAQGQRMTPAAATADYALAQVTVRARRDPQPLTQRLSADQMKAQIGAFGDPLRAVQALPGVTAPSDYSGQLLVQGGGPDDNLALIDGMAWPLPYHFGGLASNAGPELLQSVDLQEAGYGARWGGALASVLAARSAPSPLTWQASASVGLLQASASLGGPLGLGDAAFRLSGRRSYVEVFGPLVGISPLPAYSDEGGTFDVGLGPRDRLHMLALSSRDALDVTLDGLGSIEGLAGPDTTGAGSVRGHFRFHQAYDAAGAQWLSGRWPGVDSTLAAYAWRVASDQSQDLEGASSSRWAAGLREDLAWGSPLGGGWGQALSVGGRLERSQASLGGYYYVAAASQDLDLDDLGGVAAYAASVTAQAWGGEAYLQERLTRGDWGLDLGLHGDADGLLRQAWAWQPRASLDRTDGDWRCSLAWGLYAQAPSLLKLDPGGGDPGLGWERAQHWVLAVEDRLGPHWALSADAFDKQMTSLVEQDPRSPSGWSERGRATANGADLALRWGLDKAWRGTLSYGWSRSQWLQLPSLAWTAALDDEPQSLGLMLGWASAGGWDLSSQLRYHSGAPQGMPGQMDGGRMADYGRVDLRVQREWKGAYGSLRAYLELLNALNRANPAVVVTRTAQGVEVIDDLPRFPDLGIEASF